MSEERQGSIPDGVYDQIRELLVHEDQVINNRMVWLGVFQGLLFASLGFAWQKQDSKCLIVIFSLLGMIVSALLFCTLLTSTIASMNLLKCWDRLKPKTYDGPDVVGFAPKKCRLFRMVIAPWNLIPLFFIAAWCGVLWIILMH